MRRMRWQSNSSSSAARILKPDPIRRHVEEDQRWGRRTIRGRLLLHKVLRSPPEKRLLIWARCAHSPKAMLQDNVELLGSGARAKDNVAPPKPSTKLRPRIKSMTPQSQPDYLDVDVRNRTTVVR